MRSETQRADPSAAEGMTLRTTVIYVATAVTAIDEELLKVTEIDVLVMDVTGLGAVVMDAREVLDAASLPLRPIIPVRGPALLLRSGLHAAMPTEGREVAAA